MLKQLDPLKNLPFHVNIILFKHLFLYQTFLNFIEEEKK